MKSASDSHNTGFVRTLGAICACTPRWPMTRKRDLRKGDRVVVKTKNSTYRLEALGGDEFLVSGGWFGRSGPRVVTVNGCTFGGSVISTEIVAAEGLFLEFGNRVVTTRIREVTLHRRVPTGDALPN